jgi:hypothetical protein
VGSKDKGLAMFLKAAELYEAEQEAEHGPFAPLWGYGHCLAFIGKLFQDQEDIPGAIRYYEQALAVCPRQGMARKGLKECQAQLKTNP